MSKKYIAIAVILIILVGSGAFYAGMRYDKSKLTSQGLFRGNNSQFGGGNGQNRQRLGGPGGPGRNGGTFATGQILSKDANSLTVKTQDGGSKIVYFSNSTTIGKSTQGSSSDLNVGEQVMVNGQNNADGSLTAQNIQIRPALPQPNQGQ